MAYKTVNGTRLYYEIRGNEEGEKTVAFFNGVMASANSWSLQTGVFERFGYKILLHDFKGQLLSEKPEGPYTFEEHAQEANLLMKELGIDEVHIIGTSYGGEVALRFAIDFPEIVKSISIIDSVSELDEVLKLFIRNWKEAADLGDAEKFYWNMVPTIYNNSFIKSNIKMLEERADALKKVSKDYFKGQVALYDTFLSDVYMTDLLGRINCPTLLVCGEQDILKPRKFSQIMADRIQRSEFAVIPDCGHVTIFEKPDILNSLLLGFVMKNSGF
ncbi:MAG: alpha/beta hydrolase [Mesotoga sp.]|jgi:3-oxoadipate enol-lactonase|uniref:alpha/beta fold hydrolase n=2 Tax=Mesotoga TaxID=1184396 RepID=UPI000EF186C2|nr:MULTISPECIES: alpha/beta hydrolase [unclassified Mesotoga]MDI9368512.1 alpha/beta hydrolase [Thermotogota bacterium]NLT44727.1 alpha/beta hydrolase [Thermotogaceae bacterium]MDD2332994.1 alpha/beta hydrolase [Mesotoga sp.]MDD3680133.1 alpha/beta hydrolase [Mesotoga sp.]MDD5682008.1 alpha/beta hydrolase [Mesotoga sp.]